MNGKRKRKFGPDEQINALIGSVIFVFIVCLIGKISVSVKKPITAKAVNVSVSEIEEITETTKTIEPETTTEPQTIEAPAKPEVDMDISEQEIHLIALVTMGEAEGECEQGKRLVIDTILNRVESEHFPDTVYGVIYQKGQFECVWTDRLSRCKVTDDICNMVREELKNRTDDRVIFFQAGCFSPYGSPLYQVGNHYFSQYA